MSFADYFAMADFNQDGSVQLDEWMVVTERLTVSYKFIYRKNVFYTVYAVPKSVYTLCSVEKCRTQSI